MSATPTYADRVAAQIAQYAQTVNMHDLPPIFHVWSNELLRPAIKEVFAVDTIIDFYASAYFEARKTCRSFGRGTILSIGCGDGSMEIALAKSLLAGGETEFRLTGADISPILLKTMTGQHGARELM